MAPGGGGAAGWDDVAARFDDVPTGDSWVFGPPERVLVARQVADVVDVLREVDRRTRGGAWAWGYVGYEAASAFDPALRTRAAATDGPPLVCFAIGGPPRRGPGILADVGPAVSAGAAATARRNGPWRPDWDQTGHAGKVQAVRGAIAAGDVYQVNLTTFLRGPAPADSAAWYRQLAAAQGGSHHAYLDFTAVPGGRVIVSASPELFFEWTDSAITVRPMKGTARRGATPRADAAARDVLLASAKERAENIMIVDLMRNDLSRIAAVGSVRASALLDVEPYRTVWQLTSTVTAEPAAGCDLVDVFTALFPCGSVTGAPKGAAMAVIADLETRPRGPYCGAIGMVAPPGSEFRARFGVAIRTAVVDPVPGVAEYGAGGGITWCSEPAAEYLEILAKTAVLDAAYAAPAGPAGSPGPGGEFQLLETLRYEPARGCRNLPQHLRRMSDGARHFAIPFDAPAAAAKIDAAVDAAAPGATLGATARRVRLLLDRAGRLTVQVLPLGEIAVPVRLAVDDTATPASDWTRYKTTHRAHYEAAAARHPQADDVILVTATGHLMETTRASLAVQLDGNWFTPPLATGCLPGIGRHQLIERGSVTERSMTVADLRAAAAIAVISSLRGWCPAHLLL